MYVTLSLEEIAVGLVLIALFIALVYTVILTMEIGRASCRERV